MRDVKCLGNIRNTDSRLIWRMVRTGGQAVFLPFPQQILAALQNPPDPNSLASHTVATGSMLASINFLKEIYTASHGRPHSASLISYQGITYDAAVWTPVPYSCIHNTEVQGTSCPLSHR